jgi:hypothetical protein
VLRNVRQEDGGKETPVTAGGIGLVSWSSEVFFRRLEMRPLAELPLDLAEAPR